jgi:hypothetical protein
MDTNAIEMSRQAMEKKTSEELLIIYAEQNENDWTKEAFEAIRLVLKARGESIPTPLPKPDNLSVNPRSTQQISVLLLLGGSLLILIGAGIAIMGVYNWCDHYHFGSHANTIALMLAVIYVVLVIVLSFFALVNPKMPLWIYMLLCGILPFAFVYMGWVTLLKDPAICKSIDHLIYKK